MVRRLLIPKRRSQGRATSGRRLGAPGSPLPVGISGVSFLIGLK